MDRFRELCTVSAGYGASKENSVSQVRRTGGTIHQEVTVRGKVDTREMEQAQLFETADERGCTPMFGAAHRRESACIGGSLPSAVCGGSPLIASHLITAQSGHHFSRGDRSEEREELSQG